MTKRIFWSLFAVALSAAILMGTLVVAVQYGVFETRIVKELNTEAAIIAAMLPEDADARESALRSLPRTNRITLIAADGQVRFDSAQAVQSMGSHAQRPEFMDAVATGTGVSFRYSDTSVEKLIYYAHRLEDGTVLRIATSQKSALGLIGDSLTPILLLLMLLGVLALLLSKYTARHIVSPINGIDLDTPLENDVYDELSPLLVRMEQQQKELRARMDAYARKQTELSAITESMREGMILLNKEGRVLSMNASAASIFRVSAAAKTDGDMLAVTRSAEILNAVAAALTRNGAEAEYEQNGRHYHALTSPVLQNERLMGAVLLLLDDTESYNAQMSRREFTANVSHELKTPLTSISGYAEIMRDGVAKPEDTRDFAGRIYEETNRLISLVNDILELSRLDEHKLSEEKETVDLLLVAQETATRLSPMAEAKGVTIRTEGEPAVVAGYPGLLSEMIYNLVDNAVKYNVPNGSVTLTVKQEGETKALTVADTGVGIPQEHIPYVFERFYRVDKSRSKQSGGTGLGLSIVKHGAEVHGAQLELDSTPGVGTTVRLLFP